MCILIKWKLMKCIFKIYQTDEPETPKKKKKKSSTKTDKDESMNNSVFNKSLEGKFWSNYFFQNVCVIRNEWMKANSG